MKKLSAILIKDENILGMISELAKFEERKPHDAIRRLLRKSLRAKLGHLRKKNGQGRAKKVLRYVPTRH